jgi:hypothetical protein
MLETGDGFIVAMPAEIVEADPKPTPPATARCQVVARSIRH